VTSIPPLPHLVLSERADARANRLRLIEAAHEVLRERGLDAEMKEIAERAGVGIGTIYRNFPTKDDLLAAIVAGMVAHMSEAVESALAVEDPIEAVRGFLLSCFEVLDHHGDLVQVFLRSGLPPACQAQVDRAHDRGHALLCDLIRRGIASGRFRADLDPDITVGWLHSVLVPWVYYELRQGRTAEDLADAYSDLFLRGVLRDA
jgi:AcrR family transcriptional regulator